MTAVFGAAPRSIDQLPFALDHDTDISCTAHGAEFVHPNPAPGNLEFIEQQSGDFLREAFDELETGLLGEALHPFRHVLVAEGVLEPVAGGGAAHVGSQVQIDHQPLVDPALPLPDTDDAVDLDPVYENDVNSAIRVTMIGTCIVP